MKAQTIITIQPLSKNNNNVSQPERRVIFICQHCPYWTRQSHLMDNHLNNPTDECVASRREKELNKKAAATLEEKKVETTSSDSGKSREKWYYWNNGENRTKYHCCDDCDFKTIRRGAFEKHLQTSHPLDNAVNPPEPPKKRKKVEPLVLRNQEKKMLKGASPFGLRECSVVLVDIFASYKRAKSASVEGPDTKVEKMTSTAPFITTVEEAPPFFNVEDVLAGKNHVQDHISELSHQKEVLLHDLDSMQFDSFEATQCEPMTKQTDQNGSSLMDEIARFMDDQVEGKQEELVTVRGVDDSLTSDLLEEL